MDLKLNSIIIWCTLLSWSLAKWRLRVDILTVNDNSKANNIKNAKDTLRKELAMDIMIANSQSDVICSPISIIVPIAKLAFGASNDTLDEMNNALGVNSTEEIESTFPKIMNNLKNIQRFFHMHSRIYVINKLNIKEDYAKKVTQTFGSGLTPIDFRFTDNAISEINKYFSRASHGLASQVLSYDELQRNTTMVIIIVTTFDIFWMTPFRQISTLPFLTPQGKKDVTMMTRRDTLNYRKSEILDAQLLELEYRIPETSFLLVLPSKPDQLPNLLKNLKDNPELLKNEVKAMNATEVHVSIPMYSINTKIDLTDLLKKHIGRIFNRTTGLTKIMERRSREPDANLPIIPINVNKVVHQAIFNMYEEGTEHSQPTVPKEEPFKPDDTLQYVIADRPFLFYVHSYGEELFVGICNGIQNLNKEEYPIY